MPYFIQWKTGSGETLTYGKQGQVLTKDQADKIKEAVTTMSRAAFGVLGWRFVDEMKILRYADIVEAEVLENV